MLTVALAALMPAPAVLADDKPGAGSLDKVQQEIRKGRAESERLKGEAQALETDLKNLQHRLVSAAKVVQDRELRVITLEAKIADLVRQEKEKLAQLGANRSQLAGVLVALQKMVQFPPEALLAMPSSPDDLVRSAILLRAVVPEIDRRATRIRLDLQSLADTREKTADERLNLNSAAQDLDRQRAEIRQLMADRRRLLDKTLAEERRAAERVARLAAKAENLRDLMARLEEQREADERAAARAEAEAKTKANANAKEQADRERAEAQRQARAATVSPSVSITSRRGRLPLPVIGDLIGRYGENLPTGLSRKGIDIAARGGAQVIATYDGKIAFAGKFRGYGQLLIIDHGDGYHTLLAGMARIDMTVGQHVSTGEPVGLMGADGGDRPVLYVELRRKGQPINPLPWLASRNDKVSG
ncbi:peptidoglycan DD-metalloendopeptidase family protein [Thalassospiraceae bacterium LMO-SO8]|nr:peptidoglycan DD-metalloendopeptidase family protein [Alphaproteobacteria bacterium LMO-S08]WND76648.1 peptidoglycan DD-metalloendopeptidase family protein [Thalassospiraceae bacterium LMO-SO8]